MKTLIKNVNALVNENETKITNIGITDDVITFIGDVPQDFDADLTINGDNKFAIPGFVNAHTHVSMTLLRSYADDMSLMDWLQNKIWPIEAKMNKDDIYWGAMLGIAEMIKSGTTCFADMYADMEKVAQAVSESGIRASLARGIIGVAPNGNKALEENCTLFKEWNNACDGRITVMFGPHAPYTCPPDFLRKVVEKAKEYKAKIHIHLEETKIEVENCLKEYGKTPISLIEDTGIYECGVLGAHCVHANDDDIKILKKYNVSVVHNPTSNMKLASGIAPITKMLENGINVSLGTDGASSNNNLDMLEEVTLNAFLHKVNTLDPLVIPAYKSLNMGTKQGAKALGYDNVGELKVGQKADITLFKMEGTKWIPRYDIISLLVYSANSSMVSDVLVDGKLLLDNGKLTTLDEERIIFETNKVVKRLTNE